MHTPTHLYSLSMQVRALFFGHLHTSSVRLLRAAPRGKAARHGGDSGGGGGGGGSGGGGGGGDTVTAVVAAAAGVAAGAAGARAGEEMPVEMPVMYLSPSLTPRNPTPHVPAVRLYALAAGKGEGEGGGGGEGAAGEGAAVAGEGAGRRAARGAWEVSEAWDHALDIREIGAGAAVWRVDSLRAQLNLSTLRAEAWRAWLGSLQDDAAFVRHLSAQRCADEVEAPYAECKASALCAMGELEDEAYLACLRRTSKRALPPPGWVQGVKRKP